MGASRAALLGLGCVVLLALVVPTGAQAGVLEDIMEDVPQNQPESGCAVADVWITIGPSEPPTPHAQVRPECLPP